MPRKANTTAAGAVKKETAVAAAHNDAAVVSKNEDEIVEQVKYRVKNDLDPHAYVTVRNGFNGKLIYTSKRTNEQFEWEQFGDEQDMELQELKNAKNSNKIFFEKNWFLIDDPEVIAYLGVERYYRTALTYEELEDLFACTPNEIAEKIKNMPDGQKQTVFYRAKNMISDGMIDSIKTINALESSLGVELIER